ncbi:PrgI family protein [Patescibacteria group bacterium]|nr:MAG: PrgI family protein [Patescibacteria group bacterium]
MRFQVPQFIEVEDKIVGPLTLRQFIYLAGGAGFVMVFFSLLPKFLALLISAPIVALSLALAFFKVNNKPFINILEAALKYLVGSRLYLWRKGEKKVVKKPGEEKENPQLYVPRLSNSKLRDLSWTLGVKQPTDKQQQTTYNEKANN